MKGNNLQNLLSQWLAQLVKWSYEARFLVRERVKTVFSMVSTHPTVTNTSKWQFFNYEKQNWDRFMSNLNLEIKKKILICLTKRKKERTTKAPENCISTSLTHTEPQLVLLVIRFLIFLFLEKM